MNTVIYKFVNSSVCPFYLNGIWIWCLCSYSHEQRTNNLMQCLLNISKRCGIRVICVRMILFLSKWWMMYTNLSVVALFVSVMLLNLHLNAKLLNLLFLVYSFFSVSFTFMAKYISMTLKANIFYRQFCSWGKFLFQKLF